MPHTLQPNILSTNPMNRIQTEQWNCSALTRVIGDPVLMWTIFLEEGTLPVDPAGSLTTTWGEINRISSVIVQIEFYHRRASSARFLLIQLSAKKTSDEILNSYLSPPFY